MRQEFLERSIELRERLLRAGMAPRHVRRYLAELEDHLEDLVEEERSAGRGVADALCRLGSVEELARAMEGRRELRGWTARAPWVVFGVGGLASLSAAYLIACLILWSGWRLFLPGSASPFVPLGGMAAVYFGVGRMLYFGAPVMVAWGLGLMAARQRMGVMWPVMGMVLVCVVGAMARVRVGSVGSVGMGIAPVSVTDAVRLVALAVLPYLGGCFALRVSIRA